MSIKEIYNQGRVIGYSAYEIYVRHHMSEDPDTPPATEREWLASMIGSGASMLLKLDDSCFYKTVEDYTVYEVELPAESTLYAANTLVGSFFTGEANYVNNFATYVKDYGVLLSNTSSRHPDANETDHPMDTSLGLTDEQLAQLKQYVRIVDGVIIGSKTWKRSDKSAPYMDFNPDLKDKQKIRILLRGGRDTSLNVPILLTGFSMSSILSGVASEEGSVNTEHPLNGDFLGPEVVPWASKIIFSIPPSYMVYFESTAYITEENGHYIANVKTSNGIHTKSIALQKTDGTDLTLTVEDASKFSQFRSYTTDTYAPELGENPLVWDRLLDMLASDKGLDILGIALRKLSSGLPDIKTTGVLELSGTGESRVGGDFTAGGDVNSGGDVNAKGDIIADGEIVANGKGNSSVGGAFTASGAITAGGQVSAGNDSTVKSGTQYITFKDGKRLYISDTEPTGNDIPVGSIGIGWI